MKREKRPRALVGVVRDDTVAVEEPAENLVVVRGFRLFSHVAHNAGVVTVFECVVIGAGDDLEDTAELLFELCFGAELQSYFDHRSTRPSEFDRE